jgi:sulfur-oxidizing protein SoxY
MIGDVALSDGAALFEFDAPFRAYDAATVPIRITQNPDSGARIENLVLVIDENPSPVVAEFTFGEGMGLLDLETRVRVNQYSNVRAIATTDAGEAFMAGGFVRASGGCSAPAQKDAAAAMASIGKMKLRQLDDLVSANQPAQSSARRAAQIMIRHPNYSGLQRNQITRLFIGARFINELEVFQGEDLLFGMYAGISISEDPSIRFSYDDNGAETLRVRAVDTDGAVFEQSFVKDKVSM